MVAGKGVGAIGHNLEFLPSGLPNMGRSPSRVTVSTRLLELVPTDV
jgi:hypothetical protein